MLPPDRTTEPLAAEPAAPAWRAGVVLALKVAVVVAVVVFVGQTAGDAWRKLSAERVEIQPMFGLASGVVFLLSMAPMACFWRETLRRLGQPAAWRAALWSFYLSQLGKYVPGKASVVLIRTERLLQATASDQSPHSDDKDIDAPRPRISKRLVAASVFYETLSHMAVGALLAAMLTATVATGTAGERLAWIGLSLGLAAVCVTPTLPPVFRWLLRKISPTGPDAEPNAHTDRLTYGLSGVAVAASLLGWTLGGLSVWLAAASVGAASLDDVGRLPLWTLAAALPVVAGFVSLLPAGVLVREGLTLGLLAPVLGDGPALATTLAVRLIWVGSEVLLCGSLLGSDWLRRKRSSAPPAPQRDPP